ncbi:DUF805 domain-containing protein [Snuella sedimenti]|uniref:DUF805 domain-containing protein n=1 Tax=Snuella sedimenti TaxID=2798802 RepID=A0A8J7LMV7_9FLAO|nr:DUF805 domain-containing protein [Snuella sedimenti]MBJ6368034.1 DUF805 domain-containing protein [Snuella sedimenti]
MFKNPFSFNGRIRRLEFALTYLFYFTLLFVVSLLYSDSDDYSAVYALIIFLSYWILLAQGSKRCHDLGNSGFYQLIPFYIFIMLFQDGNEKTNQYGISPKSDKPISDENSRLSFKFKNIERKSIFEIITISLFLTFILSINNILFKQYESYTVLAYFGITIPGFYLLLFVSHYKKPYPLTRSKLLTQRVIYSIIYFLTIRLYAITFRMSEYKLETIPIEIIGLGLIFGLTYLPSKVYLNYNNPN